MDDKQAPSGNEGPTKPLSPIGKLAAWLESGTRRVTKLIVMSLGFPLLVVLITGYIHHHGAGEKKDFYGWIDLNVPPAVGAVVYDAVDASRRAVDHQTDGQRLHFVGYCIGQEVPSVSTKLPDKRWFILPNHAVIPAADVDGGPPSASGPSRCAGDQSLPRLFRFGASEDDTGRLTIHTEASGATVVGFAVLRSAASHWQGLPLALEIKGAFADQAGAARPMAAIAVACWDRGVPVPTGESGNYIEKLTAVGKAPPSLRTAASSRVPRGVQVACSPSAKSAHAPKPKPQSRVTKSPVKEINKSPVTQVQVTPLPTSPQTATQPTATQPTPVHVGSDESTSSKSGSSTDTSGQRTSGNLKMP